MTTIHVQLDDEAYERLKDQAQREGRSVEAAAAERLGGQQFPKHDVEEPDVPLWGMFADEPELVDEVLEDIMRSREERNRAMIEGPLRFDPEHP